MPEGGDGGLRAPAEGPGGGPEAGRGKRLDDGLTWWEREIRIALRAGISRSRWLDLTAREFSEELDGAVWRTRQRSERVVLGAWLTEYYARVKTLPSLRRAIDDVLVPRSEETPELAQARTAAAAHAWNRLFARIGEAQEAEQNRVKERADG